MIEGLARDKRFSFAEKIREFADIVVSQDKQPIGARIFVFLDDRTVLTCGADEQTLDFYQVAGILLRESIESTKKTSVTPVTNDETKPK